MKPRLAAVAAALIILTLTGVIDSFARQSHRSDIRAAVSVEADALARNLSDVVARQTSAVDALAALVAIEDGLEGHTPAEFPKFAESLMSQGGTIRSVQLAPDSILDYVFPIEGNEAAVGLDLMADPSRRALLTPAITSGETVIQGPVELVQGGEGLIVRKPVYRSDGTFWGFAAVVLDWPAVAALTDLGSEFDTVVAGARLPGSVNAIAGDPAAFAGDPVLRQFRVGATDTTWELGAAPVDGWPATAPLTMVLWTSGIFVAVMAAGLAAIVARRPQLLEEERGRALQELAEAEVRYKTTFEHAGVGIVLADAGGRILSANPSFCRIAGFDHVRDLLGTPVTDLIHPDDRDGVIAQASLLEQGVPMVEDEIRVNGPGRDSWCRTSVSLINRDDPEASTFIGIAEDITARRMAEQALAESEVRFRQLFELAPIAIQREDYSAAVERLDELRASGVTDVRSYLVENEKCLTELLAKVKIIDANPAALELQGHLSTGSEETTLLDRYSPEAFDTFVDTLTMIFEGRSEADLLVDSHASDGSQRHLDVRWYAPTVDGRPDYSNVMATISDVTELRETGRRLQALLESKDRFLASVAHELRTPLTAVVGFAEELNSDAGKYSVQEQKEFQELIAFQSSELAHIVEDLLVWARSDIGEVSINPRPFDLGRDVRQSVQLGPGKDMAVFEPDGEVLAVADPIRVRQIVRNLVTNALRYGGDHASVTVSRSDGHAVVEVSDDGPEIPPDRARRIFEPYERSDSGPTQPGSIGLGLSVSRSLARLHGGDVVFLRQEGRNVFRLTLPFENEGASPQPPVERAVDLRGQELSDPATPRDVRSREEQFGIVS